jgi:hypothetical protein
MKDSRGGEARRERSHVMRRRCPLRQSARCRWRNASYRKLVSARPLVRTALRSSSFWASITGPRKCCGGTALARCSVTSASTSVNSRSRGPRAGGTSVMVSDAVFEALFGGLAGSARVTARKLRLGLARKRHRASSCACSFGSTPALAGRCALKNRIQRGRRLRAGCLLEFVQSTPPALTPEPGRNIRARAFSQWRAGPPRLPRRLGNSNRGTWNRARHHPAGGMATRALVGRKCPRRVPREIDS